MSKPWDRESQLARVWLALEAAEGGLNFEGVLAAVPDLKNQQVSMTLHHLKKHGFAVRSGTRKEGLWNISLAARPSIAEPANGMSVGDIAEGAAALLKRNDTGLDSLKLAQQLGCTVAEVDRALLPAVMDHKLITCRLMREGQNLTLYRVSAGGTMAYDWRKQTDATWRNRRTELESILAQPVAPAPAPKPAPAAAPAPAPVAAPAPAAEVASEVVGPAEPPPPPPAPTPVPFVGTLDIDRVHRNRSPAPAPTTAPAPAPEFDCYLTMKGVLCIEQDGNELKLPVENTRKLFRYLDSLRGDAVVEAALGELR